MTSQFNTLARSGLLLALALSLVGFTPTPPPPERGLTARITQVDTTEFPRVKAYVAVTNAAGEPVAVSPGQIELKENGQPVAVEEVSGAGDAGPLATILVIDTSGSMNSGGKLDAAKAAAQAYVEAALTDDLIGILSFNTDIEYVQPLTKDRAALLAAIAALKAVDDTAMFDALKTAMELIMPIEGRKAIIVMTDGLDNRSKISPLALVQKVETAGLTISTIGLGDPKQSQGAITSLDEAGLKALASEAGGDYGFAKDAAALKRLYERFGRALHSEYVVTYTSPSELRDGVNRALSVALASGAGTSAEPMPFNPGGLVPEVEQPASWVLFAGVVLGLFLLLLIPFLIVRFFRRGGDTASATPSSGRVRLESAAPAPAPAPKKADSSAGKVKLKG